MSVWIDNVGQLDLKQIASIGSAVGATITIVTRLSSALAQYSKEEKRRREIGKATRLINFIKRVAEVQDVMASKEFEEVLPALDEELKSTLISLKTGYSAPPHRDLTAAQRVFLFFSPVGVKEWVAHILFYSLSAMTVLAAFGMILEQLEKGFSWRESGVDGLALLFWGFVAWSFRTWGLRLRSRRIQGTVAQEKAPPNALRRLSLLAWFITAVYVLMIGAAILGYMEDRESGSESISFKMGFTFALLIGTPLISFVGLAIAAWRARMFNPEPKRAWNWRRFFGLRKPMTVSSVLSGLSRYTLAVLLLIFLLNVGHVVRKDVGSLSSYWMQNLREPWIFLAVFLFIFLPFIGAVRWYDVAVLIASRSVEPTHVPIMGSALSKSIEGNTNSLSNEANARD